MCIRDSVISSTSVWDELKVRRNIKGSKCWIMATNLVFSNHSLFGENKDYLKRHPIVILWVTNLTPWVPLVPQVVIKIVLLLRTGYIVLSGENIELSCLKRQTDRAVGQISLKTKVSTRYTDVCKACRETRKATCNLYAERSWVFQLNLVNSIWGKGLRSLAYTLRDT